MSLAPLTPAQRQRFARALLWVVPLFWSSNCLIARAAAGVIGAHSLALGRWSLAFLLMLPLAWLGLRRDGSPWLAAEWRQLLVLGALGMWVSGAFVYIGGQSTSSANITLIYAATPVATATAGALWLHERMSPPQMAGVALALAGVLHVIAQGDLRNAGSRHSAFGIRNSANGRFLATAPTRGQGGRPSVNLGGQAARRRVLSAQPGSGPRVCRRSVAHEKSWPGQAHRRRGPTDPRSVRTTRPEVTGLPRLPTTGVQDLPPVPGLMA